MKPKFIFTVFLLLLSLISNINGVSVDFEELRYPNQPKGRSEYTSASDGNNNLIIFSGIKSEFPFELHNDLFVYDSHSSKWIQHTSAPSSYARREASGVFYDQSLYVFGGSSIEYEFTDTLYRYNFQTNDWSLITPLRGSIAARYKHAAAVTKDGRMYVYGGNDGNGFIPGLSYYDIQNNTWISVTQTGEIPQPRSLLSLTVFIENNEEKLFLFGGLFSYNTGFKGYCDPNLYTFDTKLRKWTNKSPSNPLSPEKRTGQNVFALGDKYFVFGGYSDKFLADSHFWYSGTNTWSGLVKNNGPFYPLGLYGAGMSCSVQSERSVCYVFGGTNGNYTAGYLDHLWKLTIDF